MLKHYFIMLWRNITRQKIYALINLTGLAMGISLCILIMLWVKNEYSYDRFHDNMYNIYRVVFSYNSNNETRQHWRTPPPLAETVKEKLPEVEKAIRFHNEGSVLLSVGEKKIKVKAGYTDQEIFDIFNFPFEYGDRFDAFKDPDSAVLSSRMADILFPDQDPLGKEINVDNKFILTVKGVLREIPKNTFLEFDFLMSFLRLPEISGYGDNDDWGDYGFNTFLLVNNNTTLDKIEKNINSLMEEASPDNGCEFYLQPLTKIHLYNLDGSPGMMIYVYILSLVAIFILLIVCINFVNLTTARSIHRAGEIGLRKVMGAKRNQLKVQFLAESIILTFSALVLALLLVELLLPLFNDLIGKQLHLNLIEPEQFVIMIALTLLTGLIAGIYPAFLLSSFQPVKVLKGSQRKASTGFRKFLIIIQFTLSVLLIFSTLVISKQMTFIRNYNLGFSRENIVYLPLNKGYLDNSDSFKEELLKYPTIKYVTRTSSKLGIAPKWSATINEWTGNTNERTLNLPLISCDKDFLETFNLSLIEGQFYTKNDYEEDEYYEFVLNRKAVEMAGIEDPIGKEFANGVIRGVMENFNFNSLHQNIQPLALVTIPEWDNYFALKIFGTNIPETLDYIAKTSRKFAPDHIFEYSFLDEDFNTLYQNEIRMGKIFGYFAFFAILLTCLGLLGLSSLLIRQRRKEIGIRKVLGSSVMQIVNLLSSEFTKWAVIANLIALPVGYLIISKWLQSFAYKTRIGVEIFLLSAGITLIVTIITISYEIMKAANTDPVKTLKYE